MPPPVPTYDPIPGCVPVGTFRYRNVSAYSSRSYIVLMYRTGAGQKNSRSRLPQDADRCGTIPGSHYPIPG
ncbi:MAG: hypothetical protein AB2L10_05760 [Methanospirillum sp.]